jgi:peptidoglycan/LPS O-acetylase OafA/YrhL
VDLFFVLSGFLIGGILIDARGSENFFSTFYVRRCFRILPLYVVACLAYFPLGAFFWAKFHASMAAMPWYVYATFTQNFWLNQSRWPAYLCQSWSLAVEEQFYLTLPLLIWLVSPEKLWRVAIVGIGGVISFRALLYAKFHAAAMTPIYVLLPCRADDLLMGLLVAIAMRNDARRWIEVNRGKMGLFIGTWIAVLAVCARKGIGVMTPWMSLVGYTGFGVFYACILMLTLTSVGRLKRFFSKPFLCWLGTIAYGLYLVHVPILNLSDAFFRHTPMTALLVAITASLVLSHLSWSLLESRLVKIGHRFVYRRHRVTSEELAGCEVE